MEKERALEGNLQEKKWEFFISVSTSGRSSCLGFVGFGELSVCCQALGFQYEQVWTSVFEGN